MKKVLMTVCVAFAVTSAYAQPPQNTTNEDEVLVTATVNIADMIDLEPEFNTVNANVNTWAQWIGGPTQFDPTNPALTGTNFRVWATRGFTISIKASDLINGSAVNANSSIGPNRLGFTTNQTWVTGQASGGPFVPPVGTTWTDILPIPGDAGQVGGGVGLQTTDQVIVNANGGGHNARFVGQFWFQPLFGDNAGGTYVSNITFTAEIKP